MLTLWLLAGLLAGTGSTGEATGRDALRSFKPEEFQRVEQVAAIPENVRNALRDALHGQPLGEPGSRWNATDVIWDDKLPSRRLIFAGFSATRWEAEWAMLPQNAKSISELRAALGRSAHPPAER